MASLTHDLRPPLLIVTGIFPPDIGGPATYVPGIASELAHRGYCTTVVALSDHLEHDDGAYPFRVVRVRRGGFKPRRFARTVAAILREGRDAQLMYVNGLFPEAVAANLSLRKPMVQKIVGDGAWERATNRGWAAESFEDFQKRRHGPKVGLIKALRSFCARRADAVIVPSRYLAEIVARWGVSRSDIVVIHNAVDLPPAICSTIPLSASFKVVTVGRLVRWKRIDGLIEALGKCKEAGLVIVGEGPERKRLEDLASSRRLSDRVYFAGHRSKEATIGLMSASDVFVLNSTYEGFPHVVLEAMGAGLPVIATAVGGTPELVRHGENGLLIAPDSDGALSDSLAALEASSSERKRLAAGARRTARRFQSCVMFDKTDAVLRARARCPA